ncbi:hypothetical protein [Acinetobacter sp. WC-323]|uniref:hypothetical protein n=1 Tax=Acinetobacter sp. WC-323 TaxID=903918 RepID=UPI00051866BE|nr:hypothetical protein [Acinetobacter sp. WC-323]
MIKYSKLNQEYKNKLAITLALIFTAFLLFIIALSIHKLLSPKKIIKPIPYQHLETDKHMTYEFRIKKFNKSDTIFIIENQKRIYLFDCSNYLETICTHDHDKALNHQIKTADIIKINDKFIIKNMIWVDSVAKRQFQHTLKDHQLLEIYEANSKTSYVTIAIFLAFTCGGLFIILWGHIYKSILKRLDSV